MNGKPIYNVGSNYLYNAGSAWVICSEYHKNNKLCQHGLHGSTRLAPVSGPLTMAVSGGPIPALTVVTVPTSVREGLRASNAAPGGNNSVTKPEPKDSP